MPRKLTSPSPPKPLGLPELRARLAELEQTLDAIRSGEVDALIVNGPNGDQAYSLKGAEQPYRQFIESMGEGAVTLDIHGTILYCNRRFADMVGMPLQRIISTSIMTYTHPHNRPLMGSLLIDSEPVSGNITLLPKRKNALPLAVRIAISPFESENDDIRCAVVTDLTEQHERKILSEALKSLQSNQRDLQNQYAELEKIRTKLEAANAAKDQFLAALSHELRTPLTPVLLTANAMAVDPNLPSELRSDMEMVRRNVELEARLIDDLLDLTRITQGKLQIAPQPTNLHDTLHLALDICQADTTSKRLRMVINLGAAHHFVNAEGVRLQQIFWNLIRNAVKFTPVSGTVIISTSNGRKSPLSHCPSIIITVTDSGIGIEPTALTRIFDAFQQESGEISRKFGGLGLGLTISKRLVELHGGAIRARSAGSGRGATFVITLPTIPAPSRKAALAAASPAKPCRPLHILLVEDHDDTRRNMTRLLSALKHTVVSAPDAASALHEASLASFDLVVSDIGLPDESGLELMKKLRARHSLRGICLSGYGMEDDVARSRAAGFSEHLTKPINFQRLEAAITLAANTPQ